MAQGATRSEWVGGCPLPVHRAVWSWVFLDPLDEVRGRAALNKGNDPNLSTCSLHFAPSDDLVREIIPSFHQNIGQEICE